MKKNAKKPEKVLIGPYCKEPYKSSSIVNISEMSHGAISILAAKALPKGAKLAGSWINTGDGGLSKKQVKIFEIKLSQGAKPGKGGILPGLRLRRDCVN